MNPKPEQLYLDLLKKTLSFTLWPEPPVPVNTFLIKSRFKRFFIKTIANILEKRKLQLAWRRDFTQKQRTEGHVFPGYADTMIGVKRLDNLQFCIESTLQEGVEGDLIETGVWRGGACIFMHAVLTAYGITDRKVIAADSFEGLPEPDNIKYPADQGDRFYTEAYLAVSQKDVENNFKKYGQLDDQVVFLKGWFKDTLPNAPIERLSILRLDGDMYGSTIEALEYLYPKLSKGGFCIIDDYALEGCHKAVDDYRAQHGITSEIKEIDWSGRYWKKE